MKKSVLYERVDMYTDFLLDNIMREGMIDAFKIFLKNPKFLEKINKAGGRELFAKEVAKYSETMPHDKAKFIVARQWAGSMV